VKSIKRFNANLNLHRRNVDAPTRSLGPTVTVEIISDEEAALWDAYAESRRQPATIAA
jgi:hypothetical protein